SDIPYTGLSIVLVADESKKDEAQALLDELSNLAWQRRADFILEYEPYAETLAKAATLPEGPILLVDHGDNCASGGSTDVMNVLRELMPLGMSAVVAGPYCDRESVASLI